MLLPADLRQPARRPAARHRPLRAVADRPEARARAGPALPALRAAAVPDLPRAKPIRLVAARPDYARDAPPGHRADHRPVSLRPARLARRFPEPGLAAGLRRLRARVRRAVPVGALLHAGQRDLRDRAILG